MALRIERKTVLLCFRCNLAGGRHRPRGAHCYPLLSRNPSPVVSTVANRSENCRARGVNLQAAWFRLTAGYAHMAGDGGPVVAAVDNEVVPLRLATDRFQNGGIQLGIRRAGPQHRAQIRLIVLT
jgi:hypothetical protein